MNFAWQKMAIAFAGGLLAVGMILNASKAQDATADDEGTVIQVGPGAAAKDPLPGELNPRPDMFRGRMGQWLLPGNPDDLARQRRPVSPYYIGVAAEKVDAALRSHVDLPDGVGLVVQAVFDGSPADEGGLKPYDILVSADGQDLHDLEDLINVVNEHSGDQMSQFTLEVIRHNQPQTVWVTPAERPQSDNVARPGFGRLMPHGEDFPMFGGPGFNLNQVPGNVSVQVQRQGDGPAKITVQRGDEKWEIEGDDPESLAQLPEDLRPMVERMLHGGSDDVQHFEFKPDMQGDLHQRLEEMEQRMRELQQQMRDRTNEGELR